jgi:hypothetical protein
VRRALHQVLELRDGEEVEAGSPVIIEGEVACGVDLVPYFKHADVVAENKLTLTEFLISSLTNYNIESPYSFYASARSI